MAARAPVPNGTTLPELLAQGTCLCAASVQEPRRIIAGALSLLACSRCARLIEQERTPRHESTRIGPR